MNIPDKNQKPEPEHDLLPPNATALERSLSISTARIGRIPVEIGKIWDPIRCPAEFLPWLAWGTALDVWQDAWHEGVRREAIHQSVQIHKNKGTRKSLTDAVRWVLALTVDPDREDMQNLEGFEGMFSIREWWEVEPKGNPQSFEVQLLLGQLLAGSELLQGTLYKNLRRAIESIKPLTSRYTLSVGGVEMGSIIHIGLAGRAVQLARFTVIPE